MGALDLYNARTRRLLTDSQKQYYSDHELNDDINQARERIAGDTECLRQLVLNVTLPAGQEVYNIITAVNNGTPPNLGPYVVQVKGVTIYWGNMRIRCQNRSYTEQEAKLRYFELYKQRPGSIAYLGANTLYINPVPDQDYRSDWDIVLVPPPLTTSSDMEVIPYVFQVCVPFYAAHLAKFSEQSLGESNIFYEKFLKERESAMYHFYSYRVRDAYRR